MHNSSLLIFLLSSFSFSTLLVTGIGSFLLGLLFKQALLMKQKSKILNLEDEMLSNHSRILSLEKRLVELKKDPINGHNNNNHFNGEMSTQKKVELKAS